MSNAYIQTLKQLYQINKFHKIKLGLENISKFSRLEGDPFLKFPCIHVAGTNGKGSVSLKIAKVLENSGFRTGLFTSPHLFTFKERIQIDGHYIKEDFIVEYLQKAFLLAEKNDIPLAFFEFITMLAFNYFEREAIDIAVFETGLGGRLDATNIIKDPLISVITSIGLDHCEILGESLEQIASEKAGIIKFGKPCVIGPFCQPINVFQKKCSEMQSQLNILEPGPYILDFNDENSFIAKSAIDVLKKNYPSIFGSKVNELAIKEGLKAKQPCRNQIIPSEIINKLPYEHKPKNIILDVGHNPDATLKICMNLANKSPLVQKHIVFGTSSMKDCRSSLEILAKYVDKVSLVQGKHARCMKIEVLQEVKNEIEEKIVGKSHIFQEVVAKGDISKTLDSILQRINEEKSEEMVVIMGSFFIMREVMEYFGIKYELDPFELNEIV